jgi:hypothetical protein
MDIAQIRTQLRAVAPTLTATEDGDDGKGWLEITGSGPGGQFTDEELRIVERLGLARGRTFAVVSPPDRAWLVQRLAAWAP